MTVPALPTSTCAGPVNGAGLTIQKSPAASLPFSIPTPIALRPADINSESRETSGRRRVDGVFAWAARISARFVTDFDPGIVTVALTGRWLPRKGAGQSGCDEVMCQSYLARIVTCAADMRWPRAKRR